MAILAYQPNIVGSIVFGCLFAFVMAGTSYHVSKRRNWWALCLPIGTFFAAVGWFLRIAVRSNPSSLAIYIPCQLFVVCSPAAFFAFNYIIYGRFIAFQKESAAGDAPKLSFIREDLTCRIFVWADVLTLLLQACGGGMTAISSLGTIGSNIFLVGIILQGSFYFLFSALFMVAQFRLIKWKGKKHACWQFFSLLYISSVFIWIRTIFRTIELAQGFQGELYTREIYLFLLDALPLFLCMVIYVFIWPAKCFSNTSGLPQYFPFTKSEYTMQAV